MLYEVYKYNIYILYIISFWRWNILANFTFLCFVSKCKSAAVPHFPLVHVDYLQKYFYTKGILEHFSKNFSLPNKPVYGTFFIGLFWATYITHILIHGAHTNRNYMYTYSHAVYSVCMYIHYTPTYFGRITYKHHWQGQNNNNNSLLDNN